eukprot:1575699-Prymnesium_polylepis.1
MGVVRRQTIGQKLLKKKRQRLESVPSLTDVPEAAERRGLKILLRSDRSAPRVGTDGWCRVRR